MMKLLTTLLFILFYGLNFMYCHVAESPLINDTVMTDIDKIKEAESIMEVSISESDASTPSGNELFWECFKKIGAFVGFIGGLLGLIVTGFVINDRWFKDAKVHSKIISFAMEDGYFENMEIYRLDPPKMSYGVKYFIKLSLNVTKKDLNYMDMEILIKYAGIDRFFKGAIYSPRNYADWKLDSLDCMLILPLDRHLYYRTTLEMNTTHLGYLTFIVFDDESLIKDRLQGADLLPESIQIVFESSEQSFFRSKNNIISTNSMTINSEYQKFIWEDELWRFK